MPHRDYSMSVDEVVQYVLRHWGVKVSPDQIVRAYGPEYRISWKKAVEVARFIRGFTLNQAKSWLTDVVKLRKPIPIRRFIRKQAHHTTPWEGWPVAKWPVKVAKAFLEVLENLENNARYKGLDVNRVVIVHAATHKGIVIRNWMPRAFGRATPWNEQTVNIEVTGVELPPDNVPKRLKLGKVPYRFY